MRNSQIIGFRFQALIEALFRAQDFQIESPIRQDRVLQREQYDIKAIGKETYIVQLKFYISTKIQRSLIAKAASDLARYLSSTKESAIGLLIINIDASDDLKKEIYRVYGIQLWDKSALIDRLNAISINLSEEFELLLSESQDFSYSIKTVANVAEAISPSPKPNQEPEIPNPPPNSDHQKAQGLKARLTSLPCGRNDWNAYERLATEILQFVFKKDLVLWEKQQRTEDGLSRFDLICRIVPFDDFWKSLIRSFNTRFILFEFKNYCDKFTQNEVYLTERYLYKSALRSVGIMISRIGPNNHAIQAAKGALREHGKLIFFLTDEDLIELLEMVIRNDNPSDYLVGKLDDWLIGLSR